MASIPDAELVDRLPGILVDGDNKDYYRGWLERQLVLNRCEDCGRWHHPPKPVCPECWSDRVRPSPVSGRGTVHLLVWLRQGPPADGVDYSTPHPVVTVELEEQTGLRFTSTVVDAAMDELAIGDTVELTWIERNGEPFPAFTRTSSAPAAR
jgi:uncharacterized protein